MVTGTKSNRNVDQKVAIITQIFFEKSVGSQLTFQSNISAPSSGSKNKQKKKKTSVKQLLSSLILRLRKWKRHIHPKRWLTQNELHGVIGQKIEIFITFAVRTSNHTFLFFVRSLSAQKSAEMQTHNTPRPPTIVSYVSFHFVVFLPHDANGPYT